jgi:hypothetical protein
VSDVVKRLLSRDEPQDRRADRGRDGDYWADDRLSLSIPAHGGRGPRPPLARA